MSRTPHRLFSSSLRSSVWANLGAAARSPRAALTRRKMSSESHAGHAGGTSNDRPWIIGSALVFGPLFLYLVSPSARKGSHGHTDHAHQSHRGEHEVEYARPDKSHPEEDVKPIADDEGTEVSNQEVKESMEKTFEADSPKDALEREEVAAKGDVTTAEASSAPETPPNAESSTDATSATGAEPNPAPAAPVAIDEATTVTNAQSTAGETSERAPESKA